MKAKYRLWQRNGVFYSEDVETRQQIRLRTKDRAEAHRLISAKNEAHSQPELNVHLARTYLTASDPEASKRTWNDIAEHILKTKHGSQRRV